MSNVRFSIIPGWVVADPRLKGKDLQVLCMLGKHTHKNDGWTRRSQKKIAEELACGRSTVQDAIKRLVEIGAVERREVISANGRDSAHWYRVIYDQETSSDALNAWDDDDEEEFGPISDEELAATPAGQPAPPAGIPAPPAGLEPAPPAGSGPAPINDYSLTTTDLPRERPPARDEGDEEENPKALRRRFRAWWATMPAYKIDPEDDVWDEWCALSPAQRTACEEKTPVWLVFWRSLKRSSPKASKTYLRERGWERITEEDEAKIAREAASTPPQKAFSKAWVGKVFTVLLGPEKPLPRAPAFLETRMRGDSDTAIRERTEYRRRHAWPEVNAMFAGKGEVTVSAEIVDLAQGFRSFAVGSDVVAGWRQYFHAMGWPWPDMGTATHICFPPVEGLDHQHFADAVETLQQKLREAQGDDNAA